ncbi:putative reverse transcriptase domain-containing protein [Tanacetum coccineum]
MLRFEGVTDWYQSQGYREPVIMSSATSTVTYTSIYKRTLSTSPTSPDYIPGPEDPQTPPVPQDEDEQPLPPIDSPTAESPGYVTESDPEEDPEEYEDDGGQEEGPDEDDEDEEEEEEEHLAPTDSTIVAPVDEPVFPPEGTEPVIPPPSTDITIGARITVRPQTSISLPPEAEGSALLVTAALPSPSLPPLPPSLSIPPPVDRRDDIPESEQPPRKRLYLSTIGSRYEIGESSTARPTRGRGIDYGFVSMVDAEERRQGLEDVGRDWDTWVDPAEAVPEIAPMTVGEVNTRVIELAELHERDTQDLYALLEDAQDSRSRISQRADMDSQRVDLLMGDRNECSMRQFWMGRWKPMLSRGLSAHSIELSTPDHRYSCQSSLILTKTKVIDDSPFRCKQTELLALQEQQRRARQPGPEARISDHQDASGDADSAALTWWNGQIRTLGPEAYAMAWEVLKKKVTDKYCPQGEIKKLEIELWNLKVKGNDVPAYTERFQELTLICTKFVANETEKVDKYISGLPDNIYGNVSMPDLKPLDEDY